MASYSNKINVTNEKIENTLLQLLDKMPFNKVSVNNICELAAINRSTFYRHYVDKYQVLDDIEQKILQQLRAISSSEFEQSTSVSDLAVNLEAIIQQMLAVVEANQSTLFLLLNQNGDANFQNQLKQVFVERMRDSWQRVNQHLKVDNHGIDTGLSIEFIVSADMTILNYAVNNPQISHQQITETFTKLLIKGPLNTLYQSVSTED
ncbi:TetR/AcrR family transcriptional regulator [Convivina praedatoris]|uniref:TetR/AcrR family transcriptional regulator n=1 Tax=Convivina praedatoris TaxID=2880963 RepID=UPI00200F5C35|nr:TetR/AcrR family transcriptional regulator [Convivina sp. LMG 32447]